MTSLFLKWVIKISYFFLTGLQHKMSHPYIAFEYIDFCDNVSVNRAALRARFQCIFRAYFHCDFVCTILVYFCVIPFFTISGCMVPVYFYVHALLVFL